jgi:hypothetical protein
LWQAECTDILQCSKHRIFQECRACPSIAVAALSGTRIALRLQGRYGRSSIDQLILCMYAFAPSTSGDARLHFRGKEAVGTDAISSLAALLSAIYYFFTRTSLLLRLIFILSNYIETSRKAFSARKHIICLNHSTLFGRSSKTWGRRA